MADGLRFARRLIAVTAPLLSLMLLLGSAAPAAAQGRLRWVEVELVLDDAGRATVTYQVRWQTTGTMHGFYFQGEQATPQWKGGTAELPGGRNVPLSITDAGGKWDVVLAAGEAWGPGEATYTFAYEADLAAAGQVAVTHDLQGRAQAVLNWSPVAWDEPLEHETLAVTFASVAAPRSGRAEARGRDRARSAHRAVGQRALPHQLPRGVATRRCSGCASTRRRSRHGRTSACSSTCLPRASPASPLHPSAAPRRPSRPRRASASRPAWPRSSGCRRSGRPRSAA